MNSNIYQNLKVERFNKVTKLPAELVNKARTDELSIRIYLYIHKQIERDCDSDYIIWVHKTKT